VRRFLLAILLLSSVVSAETGGLGVPPVKEIGMRALKSVGFPLEALRYQPRTLDEVNRLLFFYTQSYCGVVLNPPYEAPGMFVVRSDFLDPLNVGMAFLEKAARVHRIELSWFDQKFLLRLADKVGRALLSGRQKFTLKELDASP